MVRKNTIVKVTVSKGSKLAVVPSLIYENVMDAERLLKQEGLITGTADEENSELPVGTIIRQDPIAGTKVPPGTKVSYIVSKGLKPETVSMPELVGKTLEEAENLIAQNRLEKTITERHSDIYVKGFVIEQSIPSNEKVNVGTTVNIVVSKGSDVPDQMEDPDENEQNEGGQSEISKPITIDLSEHIGNVNVVVEQISGNKIEKIYDEQFDLDKMENKIVSVSITGTGRQKYAIYVNGELLGTENIDFRGGA